MLCSTVVLQSQTEQINRLFKFTSDPQSEIHKVFYLDVVYSGQTTFNFYYVQI